MNIQKNVRLNHLYRDASNYKKWGSVIFSNQDVRILKEIEEELTACFEEQMYFVASQVEIPDVFLFIGDYPFSEDDHFFHEYDSLEATDEDVNDSRGRSIKEFVEQCKLAKRKGWWPCISNAHSLKEKIGLCGQRSND